MASDAHFLRYVRDTRSHKEGLAESFEQLMKDNPSADRFTLLRQAENQHPETLASRELAVKLASQPIVTTFRRKIIEEAESRQLVR